MSDARQTALALYEAQPPEVREALVRVAVERLLARFGKLRASWALRGGQPRRERALVEAEAAAGTLFRYLLARQLEVPKE